MSRGAGGAGWCGGGAASAAVMDWSDDALGICTTFGTGGGCLNGKVGRTTWWCCDALVGDPNAMPAGGDDGGGFMGTAVADCGCVVG